jgi:large subunit ribosomal protein L24
MFKLKTGDTVKILLGKDKGRKGKIEKIFPKKAAVLVPGINMYKKHVKGQSGQKSGIYDIPRPLPFSKVVVICPRCEKSTRIGFKVIANKKRRICRKCKMEVDSSKKK